MYVGRIVVVGMAGTPFVGYRVSSRSFPNRVTRITDVGAAVQPLDPEDMKKNPYIAYNCIRVSKNGTVVSNGSHTDPIFEKVEEGVSPDQAIQSVLMEMGYERDELNTPRIAGVVTDKLGYLGIVREDATEVSCFDLSDGFCRVICTYEMNRIDGADYPVTCESAEDVARFVVEGGVFSEFEKPICAASWACGSLAVYNPHEKEKG